LSHVRYIDKTRDYYLSQGYEKPYRWAHFDEVPFQPLTKPLAESRLALISTSEIASRAWDDQSTPLERGEVGGVYAIPIETPVADLYSQSKSYDRFATTLDDVDAFFPVTRLRELVAEGRIGSLAPDAIALHNAYSQRKSRDQDAPEVLRRCQEAAVDVALMTPV
jgi:hypothetical protein